MAGTAKKRVINRGPTSAVKELLIQFNALNTQFDALLAKLDADVGVSDTNYASTLGATVCNINDINGNAPS